jgi:hypothetical protein
MADEMKVTLPEGVVKPIIEAQVIAALQGQERLITEMVRMVLTQTVRDQQTYKDYPFIEWVCRAQLREAIEAAVRGWISGQKESIEAEVARGLQLQRKGIAQKLVGSLSDAATSKWQLSISVLLGDR